MKLIVKGLPVALLSPKILFGAVNIGIRKSIMTLEAIAKKEASVSGGFSKNTFRSIFTDLKGTLCITSESVSVEYGDGQRGVNSENLKIGVKKKGSNPFLAAGSIKEKGTETNSFMNGILEKEESNIKSIILNELNKIYA